MANTAAFYFMNQGLILRFLSAKSAHEGRKAFIFVVLILMPLAAIAVSNVGWIRRAMVNLGIIARDVNPKSIFVIVSNMLCVWVHHCRFNRGINVHNRYINQCGCGNFR